MMQYYNIFYRKFGLRLISQMMSPPLPRMQVLDLPRESIYHYLGTGPLDDGPLDTENALKNVSKPFQMEVVSELAEHKGNPRRLPIDVNRLARNFRMKNPKFRPMRSLESAARDPLSVIVYNYAYIHRLYRYMRNYFTAYHTQYNALATVFKTIGETVKATERQHFIEFQMPMALPSLSQLRMAERNIDQRLARVFAPSESLMVLEMWKWLGPDRESSMIAKIPKDHMRKVNFILKESDRFVVVNLGQLADWRKATRAELELNPLENTQGRAPEQLQKMYLRLLMSVTEARVGDVPENLGADSENPVADATVDPVSVVQEPAGEEDPVSVPEIDADEAPVDHQVLDVDDATGPTPEEAEAETQIDLKLDEDLQTLELLNEDLVVQQEPEAFEIIETTAKTQEGAIIEHANNLAESGGLTAAEYRRYIEAAGDYKKIVAPNGQRMDQFITIPKEMLAMDASPQIPDKATVLDKSMLASSLLDFDRRYITEVMQRDIAAMVVNLQQAGVLVQEYHVEEIEDITSAYYAFEVKVKPLQGTSSTLKFRMPKVNPDGQFMSNGTKYRVRKQKGDAPIRKISSMRVALTSYYGKLFAERSAKRVNDYGRWLRQAVMSLGLDQENTTVTNLVPGNCFVNDLKVPKLYSTLSQGFRSLSLRIMDQGRPSVWNLNFDAKLRVSIVGGNYSQLKNLEKDGNILLGMGEGGKLILMDPNGALYRLEGSPTGNRLIELPAFEDILGIRSTKNPVDMAELRVFGKMISIGVILGYLLGLDETLKLLKVRPRIVPAGQRASLAPDEWSIVFQDETWVFSREDALASMVLSGWRDFHETTVQFTAQDFNSKDVYFNLLEAQGLGVRYLREFDLMNQMFVDPIAKDLLIAMNEPTIFTQLLVRASELLTSDFHLEETDSTEMRIKGYERFSGLLYTELVRSLRVHNARASKASYPLELNPYAVWIAINDDPAKIQCDEINPIHNLKEAEAVTFAGTGGRSGRSMVKRTRAYHKSDMGVISEATSDSSDVGINTYLSSDPQFDSLRGTSRGYIEGETGPTSLLSTAGNNAVATDRDDVKRANFVSIQSSHSLACAGYTQAAVRTGYEQVMAARNTDLFAVIARQGGVVKSKTPKGIIVTYEDGTEQGVELGMRYGQAAGLTIPHPIHTPLQVGQTFAAGDAIAYNTGFYEPDVLNPKQVVLKFGRTVKTVLMEASDTLEDSSAISKKVSDWMATDITKVRTIIVNFDQGIHKLVKAGDSVEYESILCMIEDAVSAGNSLLDDETLDTLRVLSAQSPQAKFKGVVDKVEVFYHGDREDMSASLLALADASDQALMDRFKSVGAKVLNGSVDENFRVQNEPLLLDTAAIQVTITATVGAGVGDKGVFANQMKSVFARVFDEITTEKGETVDAVFSAASIDNRIVTSPFVIGTTNTLLQVIAKKMVQAYRS